MRAFTIFWAVILIYTMGLNAQESIDFEGLVSGVVFSQPINGPGDTITTENGIALVLDNYFKEDGNPDFLNVQVRSSSNSSFQQARGNFLFMGASLKLDFRNTGDQVESVYLFYQQNSGLTRNLEINGVRNSGLNFEDFPETWASGIRYSHEELINSAQGIIVIEGPVEEIIIGGEGISIDRIGYNRSLANSLFPGDSNNDGKADYLDALSVGVHYGAVGPRRLDDGTIWAARSSIAWASENDSKTNYSDINGDGEIDRDDIQLLGDTHLGKTHSLSGVSDPPYLEGDDTDDLYMYFQFPDQKDTFYYPVPPDNEPFGIDIYLAPGNVSDSIYGVSWLWKFNPLSFEFNNGFDFSFLTDMGDENELITIVDTTRKDQGVIGCTMVRTSGSNTQITDDANIGRFNGIIVDLKGFQVGDVDIDSIRGIDRFGDPIEVYDPNIPVYFSPLTSNIEFPLDKANAAVIFPSPASQDMYIKLSDQIIDEVQKIYVSSSDGRLIETSSEISKLNKFDVSRWAKGVYFIELQLGNYLPVSYRFIVD